nr:NADH-quinone oxidoreductase subunit M [Chitinophagaceae bacterium]
TVVAGLGVILSAVYTLRMIQRVALGSLNSITEKFEDLALNEWIVLIVIMGMILWLGISPQFLMQLVNR